MTRAFVSAVFLLTTCRLGAYQGVVGLKDLELFRMDLPNANSVWFLTDSPESAVDLFDARDNIEKIRLLFHPEARIQRGEWVPFSESTSVRVLSHNYEAAFVELKSYQLRGKAGWVARELLADASPVSKSTAAPSRFPIVIGPMLFKEIGCVRDFVKAEASPSGIEKRLVLSELVAVGCAQQKAMAYSVIKMLEKTRVSFGQHFVWVRRVVLIQEGGINNALGLKASVVGSDVFEEGYALDSEIKMLSEGDIVHLVRKAKGRE